MSKNNNENIKTQTISGSFYSIAASIITIILGFVRFVLLLDALSPEDFGIVTQALFFVTLATIMSLPGLNTAYIQRENVTEKDTRTFFSLRLITSIIAIFLMMVLTLLIIGPAYPQMTSLSEVLIAFLVIEVLTSFNSIQETILRRTLSFRPIALANVISAIAMTITAPFFAYQGFGAWSLVIEGLSGQLVRGIVFWGPFSQSWRPHWGWDRETGDWYFRFSLRLWSNSVLNFIMDRFDDFWIGRNLGQKDLGYYSRAYEAAHYPRRMIANPLLLVFYSTFSRLQTDRTGLSRAFFRMMSLMVRTSFWFTLIFILAGPEFIMLLDDKWEPMLIAFQLMIIYTLLDPLSLGAANLLIAVGRPDLSARTKAIQVVFFVPSVMILGSLYGIEGVAVAANLMVLIGAVILFQLTHRFVDYSDRKLWFWPTVSLIITGTAVLLLNPLWETIGPLATLFAKSSLITVLFGGILWLTEREQFKNNWQTIWSMISPRLKAFQNSK